MTKRMSNPAPPRQRPPAPPMPPIQTGKMNNGRDCEHWRRVGNCDTCGLDQAEKRISELEAERDALAAQVERLTPLARRCIWGALVWNDHNFGDLRGCLKEETNKAGILDIDEANGFLAATPQQHLAKIRAEAVEEFWFAGAGRMTTDEAKEYVAKMWQEGEK